MAYLNFDLAKEKGISIKDVFFLQILHQNQSGAMEEFLKELIDENDIASYDSIGWISFIKGTKKDSDYSKMRLSKKGRDLYNDLTTYKTVENDFKLYDYVNTVYKNLEKGGGSRNKVVNLIAAFRLESGFTHKQIYYIMKEFLMDKDNMEYNHKLEYMIFKPDNAYEKFKLENSRLWNYYQDRKNV